MKNLTLWKKKKYLQACRILDLYNKKINPCNITIKQDQITCNYKGCEEKTNELCCYRCLHLSKKGCTVNSIACKMSYCYVGASPAEAFLLKEESIENKRFIKLVTIIQNFFYKYNIPYFMCRLSMENTFKLFNNPTEYEVDYWTAKLIPKQKKNVRS